MSTCDCEKQDQYANCCMRKIVEKRNKSLETMIDTRNIWLNNLEAKASKLVEALECILKKNPNAVNQNEAADMAVEFHMQAHKALRGFRGEG